MAYSAPDAASAPARDDRLHALATRRWRLALALTVAIIVVYFGFISLIAYDRPLLATLVAPGLTLGILLGALVIVVSWLLTYAYVRWANTRYDGELQALQSDRTPNVVPSAREHP